MPPFRVEAKHCGFQTGVDIQHLNRLNDKIESEHFRRELRRDAERRRADQR